MQCRGGLFLADFGCREMWGVGRIHEGYAGYVFGVLEVKMIEKLALGDLVDLVEKGGEDVCFPPGVVGEDIIVG